MDVTPMLQSGANVVAVAAENVGPGSSAAGLIGTLRVEFAEGEPLLILTDAQWRSSTPESAGWERPAYNDASWVGAKVLGALGMGPWGDLRPNQDVQSLPARYLRREFPVAEEGRAGDGVRLRAGILRLLYLNGRKVSGTT
jgi:alpha-L-rhamnosidase